MTSEFTKPKTDASITCLSKPICQRVAGRQTDGLMDGWTNGEVIPMCQPAYADANDTKSILDNYVHFFYFNIINILLHIY